MAWKVRSGRALANFDTPPEMAYTGRIRPSWMAAAVLGREILPPEAAPGKSDLALAAMVRLADDCVDEGSRAVGDRGRALPGALLRPPLAGEPGDDDSQKVQ